MKYHLWTIGCQMNEADSQRVGSELEKIGYRYSPTYRDADVVVINTCVVRQSAEDKVTGFLWSLKPLKEKSPDAVIALMGCMVGVKGGNKLKKTFPHVDVFMPPSDPGPLISYLLGRENRSLEAKALSERYAIQDGELVLPLHQRNNLVSAHVPVIYGCNHVCTFCIIPSRRGIERSRPVGEIAREVRSLVDQGVKEVTLLGQIVDRYGYDVPDGPRLANLLHTLNDIEGLERIRFLTSHPNFMTDDILQSVAQLPKVCEHIEVPIQAGDDEVLKRMKRGYTSDEYRQLIHRIREYIPNACIATDIIVGFPGETEAQFQATLDVLAELKMDVCHVAMYSPRPGTVSAKVMSDDIPPEEKKRRLQAVNALQEEIVTEINSHYVGQTVEVLVEEDHKGKWKGRTRTNKLVFFEDEQDHRGQLVNVTIEWAGPWSMRGFLEGISQTVQDTLPVIALA
ncbi:MAG: tRNA (N6-isopentenyl adenosine(37)-C2)-methylthiotransferase MiaB [Phycisphaerae bacterium]|nr:tRNA (N6-isopentenyl adenosine(37)-C2)-methylthiotransferase MiaB [Phycisphaerae bacterium]NIX32571.1 tRNA (N6-isopentenyl adenosine(37)-C2)-methylthiotransferase MiaB [Phycisphaerae bacterium]